MNTEDLAGDDRGDWKSVEAVNKRLPDFDIAPPLAFVVKAVDSCDIGALVVSSEEEKVFGEFEFVAEEQQNCLKGLLSSINVVAEEKIV
jgi:hypothetical protein